MMRMDEDDVRQASERFYAAVNAVLGGDASPMLAIWSRADDTTYCDTRGAIQCGRAALLAYWQQAAEQNAGSGARLSATAHEQAIYISGELAYTVLIEEVRQADGAFVLDARATNVYRREDGEWRMIHRHADAPPMGAKEPQGE
jgi:ketosteroid isomerase-like protein